VQKKNVGRKTPKPKKTLWKRKRRIRGKKKNNAGGKCNQVPKGVSGQ